MIAMIMVIALVPVLVLTVSAADNRCQTGDCSGTYENGFCSVNKTHYQSPDTMKGNGTAAKPYEISNAGQLYWLREKISSGNYGVYAKLTADIIVNQNVLNEDGTLNDQAADTFLEWKPIVSSVLKANFYYGTFDGNGYSISGLYTPNSDVDCGFFGKIGVYNTNQGEIKNLTIKDSYFRGTEGVGGIVGRIYSENGKFAAVNNCVSYSTVIAVTSNSRAGGIVGASNGNVSDCINYGNVSGIDHVGGIAGDVREYADYITRCVNNGSVTGTGTNVGGIVGNIKTPELNESRTEIRLAYCGNNGSVTGTGTNVGGIVGNIGTGNAVNLSSCYNTGMTTGNAIIGGGITANNVESDSSYYLEGSGSGSDYAISATKAQFLSGEVAYLLNGKDAGFWKQAVGYTYPTTTGADVYRSENGNYMNNLEEEFATLNSENFVYTGSSIIPDVTVKIGDVTLTKDKDYTVSYDNNSNVGDHTVTIKGMGNYEGEIQISYTISQANIETVEINIPTVSYTGSALKPALTVTFNGNTLTEGVDFDAVYTNNTNASDAATVTLTGKGNFKGTVTKKFTISKADITFESPTAINSLVYNREAQTLINAGQTDLGTFYYKLWGDTEWSTELPTATDAYSYIVCYKIVASDPTNYNDVQENYVSNINLARARLTGDMFSVSEGVTYNKEAQTPVITAADYLVLDRDYTVSWDKNDFVNADTYTVTIEGKGNYTADHKITKSYVIAPQSISDKTVNISATEVTYNGQDQKPTVTVDGLQNGDYTVVFKRNGEVTEDFTNAGEITIEITGQVNYKDTIEKTFTIEKAEVNLTISAPATSVFAGNKVAITVTYDHAELTAELVQAINQVVQLSGEKFNIQTTTPESGKITYIITVSDDVVIGNGEKVTLKAAIVNNANISDCATEELALTIGITDSADIAELEAALEALETLLAGKADQSALNEAISKLEGIIGNMNELGNDTTLVAEITALIAEIDALKGSIGNMEDLGSDTTLVEQIKDIHTAIGKINETIATLATKAEVEESVNELDGRLDALEAEFGTDGIVTALRSELDTLKAQIGTIDTTSGTLVAQLSALAARVKNLEDTYATKAALEEAVKNLNDAIATKADKATFEQAVIDLNKAIEAATAAAKKYADDQDTALESELVKKIEEADALLKGAIDALQKELDDTQEDLKKTREDLVEASKELRKAFEDGDTNLSNRIVALTEALNTAKAALEKADADNKAELVEKIEEADALLKAAIEAVQKNLDEAEAALNAAIAAGDKDLNDKITALTEALDSAKAALDATDATNKKALEEKIDSATKALTKKIEDVQNDLEKAVKALKAANAVQNTAFIIAVETLSDAIDAAEAAAAAGDAALDAKLAEAVAALEEALNNVQKNLDSAKTELNKAIADGDTALDGKITALNEALATAKAALEATDAANKTELNTKIDEAYASLDQAIKAVQNELNGLRTELEAKDDELQTFIIIVCVISVVTLCGTAALAVCYICDKKRI